MKKLFLALTLLAMPITATAGITEIPSPYQVYAPDDETTLINLLCQEDAIVQNLDTGIDYRQRNCAGVFYNEIYLTPVAKIIMKQTTNSAIASTIFTGSTSQYVRGDGSLATLPTPAAKTFNYPSRTLNSCFQISSTKDADFHYKVDVTTGLSLTTGAQGTVTATSYTNSGCTTAAQSIVDGTSSQTGTLIVGLGINQIASIGLDGTLPANKWLKITTANTVGAPTFTIRGVQSETIQP